MTSAPSHTPVVVPRPRPTLAKIIATVGPASQSPETITRLIRAGVGIFRLNFSHGTLEDHAERLAIIRAAATLEGQPVGVLGDLQGPKIRLGKIAGDGIELVAGQSVVLVPDGVAPPTDGTLALPSDYSRIGVEVEAGHRVLINDGLVRMIAVPLEPGDAPRSLRCSVLAGGLVSSRKGINLPDSEVSEPAITEQDWRCVEWAVGHGLDFLALSFVRKAAEVRELKIALQGMCSRHHSEDLAGSGSLIPVIAKIEKPQALAEIDDIVDAADAIMVARGDLGVEMELAQVPLVQKRLIAKADEWGKPCIVATQMLESMVSSSVPTRAETTDVANAVFDRADAVMLSAETATGKHPVLVVETMRRIVAAAEDYAKQNDDRPTPSPRLQASHDRTAALAHGAWHVAKDLGAKLVVCWSQGGGTARALSQAGLRVPIVAYTNDPRQVRRMALDRGVSPRLMSVPPSGLLSDWNAAAERDVLELGWVEPGDRIVLVAGRPLGVRGATTTLAVHTVGDKLTGFTQHRG